MRLNSKIGTLMKNLIILFATLFVSTPAYADTIQGAAGGTILNGSNTVINATLDYASKTPDSNWQRYLDVGYIYNETHGILLKDQVDADAKLDYNLDKHNYLQGEVRYAFNQLGFNKNKAVFAIGNGYRLIHTKKMKLSFETSIGMAEATHLNEFVVRESVWASYNLNSKTHIDEKFLIEHGSVHDYIHNTASVVFDITNHVNLSVTNIYIDDYSITKLTTFNIGVKF